MAAWRGVLGLGLLCLLPVAGERGPEGRGVAGVASGAGGGGGGRRPAPALKEGWRAPASLSEVAFGDSRRLWGLLTASFAAGGAASAGEALPKHPARGSPWLPAETPQPSGAGARADAGAGVCGFGGPRWLEVGGANWIH